MTTRHYSLLQHGKSLEAPLGWVQHTACIELTDSLVRLSTYGHSLFDRTVYMRVSREQAATLLKDWRKMRPGDWEIERWAEQEVVE